MIGIVIGIIIANVPQLVPVEKAIKAERAKTIIGTNANGKPPATTVSDKNEAKPSPPSSGDAEIIVPIDQAIVKIIKAGTIDPIPSFNASEAVLIVNRRRA